MTDRHISTAPETLIAGYHRFRANRFREQSALYEELTQGQKPHTLVIACSDSRVDPAVIFDCAPGELFVVRNVANLAPEYAPGGVHGVSAALEFAVKVLKVKGVVVMGHKQCGGVAACAGGLEKLDSEFLGPWLEVMESARAEAEKLTGDGDHAVLVDMLELRAVAHSVERLKHFPFVREAIEECGLELHGARFGIATGQLEWMQEDGTFEVVSASY